jgi:sec-independent protein translocase protein TatA
MITTLAVLGIGGWEMVLILAVVLILFGAKRLPELAKGLGHGIKEFKKATRDVTDEIQRSVEDDPYHQPPPRREIEYTQEHKDPHAAPAPDSPTVARTDAPAATDPAANHNSNPPKV